MVTLLATPWLVDFFYKVPIVPDGDSRKLDSLVSILNSTSQKGKRPSFEKTTSKFVGINFDPNTSEEGELIKIFGKKIAGTIVRFRKKGGKFFIKKDLTKIYGMDASVYSRVEQFILLPEELTKGYTSSHSPNRLGNSLALFDINTSDTIALQKLKGIGKVLSARIIKFRDHLGGFISKDQYQEVFGLDTSVVTTLKKNSFIVEGYVPSKININNAAFSELAAHPYIGKKYSSAIVNYRTQHKVFSSMDELKLIRAIPERDVMRMLPYLEI
jgi:competence protein ComEA